MSQTVISTPESAGATPRQAAKHSKFFWKFVEALASLRLTVTLFALSLALVFYGTLAQVDEAMWTVVLKYFRSIIVLIPLKVVFFRALDVPGTLPFPGGWTLGFLLLVNLLAAHAMRFRLTW